VFGLWSREKDSPLTPNPSPPRGEGRKWGRASNRRWSLLGLETLEERLAPTGLTRFPTRGSPTLLWARSINLRTRGKPTSNFPFQTGDEADLTSALKVNATIDLGNQDITLDKLKIGASSGSKTFTVFASANGSLNFGGSAAITKTAGGADVISAPIHLSG